MDKRVTIDQVYKLLGVDPSHSQRTMIGAIIRERWLSYSGQGEVDKPLRAKPNGGGTQCKAVYPADWLEPRVVKLLKELGDFERKQIALF